MDRQVKVRGFRIEPAEVEAILSRIPGLEGVAVVALADPGGGFRLVAYCAPASLDEATLRRFAEAHLPRPMVPATFLLLERLPLNANGKVDRAALPAPEQSSQQVEASAVGLPEDALERTVAAIWRRVLDLDSVARDRSFFELGGHSLLAARVVAELETALGRPVPLVALFDHPTVADLATYLRSATAETPMEAPTAVADSAARRAALRRQALNRSGARRRGAQRGNTG